MGNCQIPRELADYIENGGFTWDRLPLTGANMDDYGKGIVITALGVLFVVPDSLYVRLIEADDLVIAFWRLMISGLLILAGVLGLMGGSAIRRSLSTGMPGVVYVVLLGSTGPGFVLAISQTSVANVVFIFASMPIFAAIFGLVFLGEPISKRMILTMIAVAAGLSIIAYGSSESELASWKGDLWAVYVCIAYAGALTAARQARHVSLVPAIPLAYIGSAVLIAPFISPLAPVEGQWHLLLGHGAFIAIATFFLTLGPRYLSSAEVSLMILLESVLAPILVWLVIGEDPGRPSIVGGVIVIAALVASNVVALRYRSGKN